MTKLYYSAGACSMSCEIAFEEMGIAHEAILLDWEKNDAHMSELHRLNPLGAAPVVVTESGQTLTQNSAVLEYFADLKKQTQMLPAPGTIERAHVLQWLSFAATDFHKSFVPLFALQGISENPTTREEVRNWAVKGVQENLAYLDKALAGKEFITGSQFTVADCYLFVVAGWTKFVQIPLDPYKNVAAYVSRVYQRPSVQKTLKKAGILS
jgi:glutathione S-transferase